MRIIFSVLNFYSTEGLPGMKLVFHCHLVPATAGTFFIKELSSYLK
jgi:hypothetical protein